MKKEISPEFMHDLIIMAEECVKNNSYGFKFRTPEIDGECVEFTISFKPITKEDK